VGFSCKGVRGSELVFALALSLSALGEESMKGLFGESRMGNLDSGVTGGEFGTEGVAGGGVAGIVVTVGLRLEGGGEKGATTLLPGLFSRR